MFTSIVKAERLPGHHILCEGTVQAAWAKCPCGWSAEGHKDNVNNLAVEHLRSLAHGCRAGRDGDCIWEHCPQLRDGEPAQSHRHCPLDTAFPSQR